LSPSQNKAWIYIEQISQEMWVTKIQAKNLQTRQCPKNNMLLFSMTKVIEYGNAGYGASGGV
jgi:hypothetical protein